MRIAVASFFVGLVVAGVFSGAGDRYAARDGGERSVRAADGDMAFPTPGGKRLANGSPLESRRNVEASGAAGDLLALSFDAGIHRELTLIDAKQRVLAVYHVNSEGEVSLRSVRAIGWDMMMDDFNGEAPSPREIRSLVEQQ